MAKKQKEEKTGLEFIESPEALASEINKAQTVIEKNKNLFTYAGGAILLCLIGYFGYKWFAQNQDQEAQAALFPLVSKFETDSAKGLSKDFIKIADEYGMSKAGNLAHFYAGVASLKDGKYDEAIEQLKDFSSSDLLVQARAYSLIGDAYVEKKAYDDAISFYKKASDYKPNKFFTPIYMMKLAGAYEANKQNDDAVEVYSSIIEKFEDSQESTLAKKYKSKLEGAVSE
ncbi:MAG: tetratricopeptide repeat protein [Bacteroidota bacterium]